MTSPKKKSSSIRKPASKGRAVRDPRRHRDLLEEQRTARFSKGPTPSAGRSSRSRRPGPKTMPADPRDPALQAPLFEPDETSFEGQEGVGPGPRDPILREEQGEPPRELDL